MTGPEALLWLRTTGASARRVDGGVLLDDVPPGVKVPLGLTAALRAVADDLLAAAGGARPAPAPGAGGWSPRITRFSDVQPEEVRWLWPGYLPLGKLTVLDGDPGNGKSTLTCDLAARLSSGRAMPDGGASDRGGPAGVVLLSAEDGPADTIRPRLDAAGADVRRVALLECAVDGERERAVTLADLDLIAAAIAAVDARLVVVDPLMAYLDRGTDSYRDQDVRAVLAPLARLADRTGAAIVVIRHFSKAQHASALHRGGGSIGIIGAARVGLVVAPDPDEPDGPRRVLAVGKSNLAEKPPALAYRLVEAANGAACVVWEGATRHTAADLVAQPADSEERGALDEAKEFLRQALAGGAMSANAMLAAAKRVGIAERTLKRAKRALGVESRRGGFGKDGGWVWALAADAAGGEGAQRVPTDAIGCHENALAPYGELGTLWGGGDPPAAPPPVDLSRFGFRGAVGDG